MAYFCLYPENGRMMFLDFSFRKRPLIPQGQMNHLHGQIYRSSEPASQTLFPPWALAW